MRALPPPAASPPPADSEGEDDLIPSLPAAAAPTPAGEGREEGGPGGGAGTEGERRAAGGWGASWPVLDAEGGGAAVGGLGSWDFGERWVDLIDAVGAAGEAVLAEWRSIRVRPPPWAGGGGHERVWQRRGPGKGRPLCTAPGVWAPGRVVECHWRPRG